MKKILIITSILIFLGIFLLLRQAQVPELTPGEKIMQQYQEAIKQSQQLVDIYQSSAQPDVDLAREAPSPPADAVQTLSNGSILFSSVPKHILGQGLSSYAFEIRYGTFVDQGKPSYYGKFFVKQHDKDARTDRHAGVMRGKEAGSDFNKAHDHHVVFLFQDDTFTPLDTEYISERDLQWSPSGTTLAYTVFYGDKIKSTNDMILTDNHNIVFYDATSQDHIHTIKEAIRPRWLTDTKLLFLRTDGLYHYDLSTGRERFVAGVDGVVNKTTGIDLSFDKRYLVWSSGKKGMIDVFSIEDRRASVALRHLNRITSDDHEFFWPVAAPDSHHFVIQSISSSVDPRTNLRIDPALEIYSFFEQSPVTTVSLEKYDFNQSFTDDWVLYTYQ